MKIADFASYKPDLIVEVAHPDITREYGAKFVEVAGIRMTKETAN